MGDDQSCGTYEFSHDQSERPGYHGCDVSGIHTSYCKNLKMTHVSADNLHSDNGEVRGLRFINQCQAVKVDNFQTNNLTAGYQYQDGKWRGKNYQGKLVEYTASYPNIVPVAVVFMRITIPRLILASTWSLTWWLLDLEFRSGSIKYDKLTESIG